MSGISASARRRTSCIFDPEALHRRPAEPQSQGKNTPFLGYELPGVVRWTLVAGEVRFERG